MKSEKISFGSKTDTLYWHMILMKSAADINNQRVIIAFIFGGKI